MNHFPSAMSSNLTLPALPPVLKPIGHQLKAATEHSNRDPVVTYWCRLAALQSGMKLDKSSKESLAVLLPLMDWLETEKKAMKENEAIAHEVVGSAHVENYAIKLFGWADKEDRAARFNKNVVKAFYNAGVLFDVMTAVFGELTPENAHARKYAKWKAAYIHNCLKNGETPVPGPAGGIDEGLEERAAGGGWAVPQIGTGQPEEGAAAAPPPPSQPSQIPTLPQIPPQPAPRGGAAAAAAAPIPAPASVAEPVMPSQDGNVHLDSKQIAQAKKFCTFASSALDYEDLTTAKDNLVKALNLLNTGQC